MSNFLLQKILYSALIFCVLILPNVSQANYFTLPVKYNTPITAYFDHGQGTSAEIYYDGTSNYSYDEHNGTDFNGVTQDDIYAVYDGEIKSVFWNNYGGWTVHLWHSDIGLSTLYAHVGTTTLATTSDTISRYTHIAEMDNTGSQTSGDHLHFGVVDSEYLWGNRIDPFGWSSSSTDPWSYNQGYLWTTNPPSFDTPTSASTTNKSGYLYANETWTNDNIYLVGDLGIDIGATLTIEPGTIVKFVGSGSGINVYGTLNAEGTMDEPVYFTSYHDDTIGGDTDATSTPPTEGDWKRIYVTGLADLDHVVIRYGGNDTAYYSSIVNAGGVVQVSSSTISKSFGTGLFHFGAGTALIENSFIMDNLKYGIVGGGGGNLTFINNKFYNNNIAAAFIADLDSLGNHYGNIDPYNIKESIWIEGTLNDDVTLRSGLPFHISGEWYAGLTVNSGASLTMEEGVIMKNSSSYPLHVIGEFLTEGTETNPVYITSYHDDTVGGDTDATSTPPTEGDWKHILIDTAGVVNLNHTFVRYGGGIAGSPDYYASIVNTNGILTISSSTISNAYKYGVFHSNGTTTITDSVITDNIEDGLHFGYGNLSVSNSVIYNNGNYGLNSPYSNTANAENNYWGSGSGPYHASLNPGGSGDNVSDYVDFDPWLTSVPF